MQKGLISIIIPTHKGRDLDKVISAIHESTYKDYEIIIVDEGFERSKQKNLGIGRAKGEYLLFLDSDMRISPGILQDCVDKIRYSNGIYMLEKIKTPGFFARIRDWERQFYTGTAIDCVRFVRTKYCPYYDETLTGTEDSDWDRYIPEPKVVSNECYYHYEDINMWRYFKKKAYYTKSMDGFIQKHPQDKLLDFKWRCFWVFIENGKWKRLFNPMVFGVIFLIIVRGVIFLCRKKS